LFRCPDYAEFSGFHIFILLDSTIKIPYIIAVFKRPPKRLSYGRECMEMRFSYMYEGCPLRLSPGGIDTKVSVKEKDNQWLPREREELMR
jgi:hypothetical protein